MVPFQQLLEHSDARVQRSTVWRVVRCVSAVRAADSPPSSVITTTSGKMTNRHRLCNCFDGVDVTRTYMTYIRWKSQLDPRYKATAGERAMWLDPSQKVPCPVVRISARMLVEASTRPVCQPTNISGATLCGQSDVRLHVPEDRRTWRRAAGQTASQAFLRAIGAQTPAPRACHFSPSIVSALPIIEPTETLCLCRCVTSCTG